MSGYKSYSMYDLENLIELQNKKIKELEIERKNIDNLWTDFHIQCHNKTIDDSIKLRRKVITEVQEEIKSRIG